MDNNSSNVKSEKSKVNSLTEKQNSATIPVATAAEILGVSPQTVRLLLRMGAVKWGVAYKLPHSRHFSYLIYAEKFYSEIGGDARC